MAGKFYLKYVPVRLGLTGSEFLSQWLDANFPTVTFTPALSDGISHFGILEGPNELFAMAIAAIEGRFSCQRVTEDVFIGLCKKYYNPVSHNGEETPPTFAEYMLANFNITVPESTLEVYKKQKVELLKEIAKKKFDNLNDSLSDLARSVTLLVLHYNDLTVEEKATVDAKIATLKSIYTKDASISAFVHMVDNLTDILGDYYTAKVTVESAVDEAEVNAVVYE